MTRSFSIIMASLLLMVWPNDLQAQNRGNMLSFQGIEKALAFSPGSLGSGLDGVADLGGSAGIFYNPASLAGIKTITVTAGFSSIQNSWWENQNYRPNRRLVTLPFYLEGLYIPDPVNNGLLDSDVFYAGLLDTSYIVADPEMGVEHFSEEAADWKRDESASGLNHIGLALPVELMGKILTLSAGYGSLLNGMSYDLNTTYLTPHPGYIDYEMPPVVDGSDTVRIDWYRFERLQRLKLDQISLGIGYAATENILVGLGLAIFSGSSDELQYQDKVGYFDLIDQNEFIWSYDTLNTHIVGDASFSGTALKLGLILDYERFRLGLAFNSAFDMKKDWQYDQAISYLQGDTLLTTTSTLYSGQDVMRIPASYSVGIQMMPADNFTFLLSYEIHPYRSAEFELDSANPLAAGDTMDWVDQSLIKFGFQYQLHPKFSLNALYRSIPQVFIPDGTADREVGPEAVAYRVGGTIDLGYFGVIDLGYEIQDLKYQDNYFSNTNYAREQARTWSMVYSYTLK